MCAKKIKVLDRLLAMSLVDNEQEALAQVMRGNVVSDKKRFNSLHETIEPNETIRLKHPKRHYVSRGGEKLASVFDDFKVSIQGQLGLDAGASTGGFTDYCLQQGASGMVAIDVSYGMLAHALRIDERVVTIERTNIRKLSPEQLNTLIQKNQKNSPFSFCLPVDFIVGDLSFISIRHVLPSLLQFLTLGGWMILLIKPQFEARPEHIPIGGVIIDPLIREKIVADIATFGKQFPIETINIIPSGLTGQDGNQEYFWGIRKRG